MPQTTHIMADNPRDNGKPDDDEDARAADDAAPADTGKSPVAVRSEEAPAYGDGNGGDGDDAPAPAVPDREPRPSRLPLTIAVLSLLVSLAAAGGIAILLLADDAPNPAIADLRDSQAGLENGIDGLRDDIDDARDDLAALHSADGDLDDALDALEERLDDGLASLDGVPSRLASLESALRALQGISSGLRDTWLLAEAEHYLQIANAQLDLAGNPGQARRALELADERLASLANPALTDIRRAIADEIRRVNGIDDVDVEGTALALSSLADGVAELPLRNDVVRPDADGPAVDEELSGMARAFASLKASLSDVISVRRSDAPVTPLLPPDAAFFLRNNVALSFNAARLALLNGDETLYAESLGDAADWVGRYFDGNDRRVTSMLETIDELRDMRITAPTPDISGSLALLRQYMAQRSESGRAATDSGNGDGPGQ